MHIKILKRSCAEYNADFTSDDNRIYLDYHRLIAYMTKQGYGWLRKEVVLMVFGFFTVLTLYYTPRLFLAQNSEQLFREIRQILFFGLGNYTWAILTFVVFFLGEKFPLTRNRFVKNLFWQLLCSQVVNIIFTTIYVITTHSIMVGSLTTKGIPLSFIINTIVNGFIYYTGTLAVHQAIFYSRKFREREFRLQQAELEMLKLQLHPHFFFNTLNAISALMYRSPKDADRMITRLGDLFRIVLKRDKSQEIPLKEELEFLESYLSIHQTLMGKRLQVEWKVAPEALDALVPNLILQPLVENAIKHGIETLEEGGRIEISAALKTGKLVLAVRDNGSGLIPEKTETGGVGLSNIQARLKNLYDGNQHFTIRNTSGEGGVIAQIEIPFHENTPER